MADSQLTALVRLVVKQGNLINALASLGEAVACLVLPALKRCSKNGCDRPATVQHRDLVSYVFCDRCAAAAIVGIGRRFTADASDPLNSARGSLMQEEHWVDLPDAGRVRTLCDYVDAVRGIDEQEGTRIH